MMKQAPLDLAGRVALIDRHQSLPKAVADLLARPNAVRQERLSGIHNPWGHAIGLTDPWLFLEFCESQAVVGAASAILGPNIILWDSELFPQTSIYADFVNEGREGRYWPVEQRNGALILASVADELPVIKAVALDEVRGNILSKFASDAALYVIRVMPATSLFIRDPQHVAHQACMEEQVLVNYASRPLWVIGGADQANNDLVTGFSPPVPLWASGAQQ